MDQTKQPGITYDGIILRKLTFSREPEIPKKCELNIAYEGDVSISETKDKMTYELTCTINDKDKSFEIVCSMIGLFSIMLGQENMTLEEFSQVNAPALMLPFIREVVTSTTIKAGMPPLLIWPLNVNAITKKGKLKD